MTIERIPITDRDQWLKLRQQDVTASAAGALLGVHDYVTPFALWALKSGAVSEDPEETAAMTRGRLLEPVAVQLIKEKHPEWTLQHGGFYLRDPDARLGATPDLFVSDPKRGHGVIQIKSVESSVFRKKWKDENGEVAPPLWIAVQGILEAHLEGADWAAVAALVVGFGIDLHMVDIPIHAGVIANLKAKTNDFWRLVEIKEVPPVDYGRDGEMLTRLYSQSNGAILDLTGDNRLPELCQRDAELLIVEKNTEKERKEIRNEILAKLGPAEGAICDGWSISAKTTPETEIKAYVRKAYRTIRKKQLQQMEKAS